MSVPRDFPMDYNAVTIFLDLNNRITQAQPRLTMNELRCQFSYNLIIPRQQLIGKHGRRYLSYALLDSAQFLGESKLRFTLLLARALHSSNLAERITDRW